MKRLFLIPFMLVLVGVLVFGGCAEPTPTPTPTPTPKPIELKWTLLESDSDNSVAELHRRLVTQIAERTGGRVTLEMFWGSVLGKTTDYLKMVSEGGVAQGGTLMGTYHQWEIPMWSAPGLPFLTHGYRVAGKAIWELGQEWAPMQAEMDSWNVKPLGAFQPHETYIATVDPITSLDDLKGTKLWVLGFWQQMADALGIVNVPLTPPEVYDAIQKGTLAGIWGVVYHGPKLMRFSDLCKHFYDLPFGGNNIMLPIVNQDVWNQISAQDRQAIEDAASDLIFNVYPKLMDDEVASLRAFYEGEGVTEYTLSTADLATIENLGPSLILDDWVKTAEERGVPGKAWLQLYKAKVEELSK